VEAWILPSQIRFNLSVDESKRNSKDWVQQNCTREDHCYVNHFPWFWAECQVEAHPEVGQEQEGVGRRRRKEEFENEDWRSPLHSQYEDKGYCKEDCAYELLL